MLAHKRRHVIVALVTYATFIDMLAYSVVVPMLPDLGRKLGTSPASVGSLFASFGATLLAFSAPAGILCDRFGRRSLLLVGFSTLAAATLMFAGSETIGWLFVARLLQGAADAVTWVAGLAIIADLHDPAERGGVVGVVMSGAGLGLVLGPPVGGWLYEVGGMQLPLLAVSVLALAGAVPLLWLEFPQHNRVVEIIRLRVAIRAPALSACLLAVVGAAATISMLELVLPLYLSSRLGIGPARIGLVFGGGAIATTLIHPLYGRLSDRWGGRTLTIAGLAASAIALVFLGRIQNFESAFGLYVVQALAVAMVITPSLGYVAKAVSKISSGSFGTVYGLYNVAWGIGLVSGPAIGGFLFERLNLSQVTSSWALFLVVIAMLLAFTRTKTEEESPMRRWFRQRAPWAPCPRCGGTGNIEAPVQLATDDDQTIAPPTVLPGAAKYGLLFTLGDRQVCEKCLGTGRVRAGNL